MNFDPKTKAWIILICTAISSGMTSAGAIVGTGLAGHEDKGWVITGAVISFFVGAATAILHALMSSPNDQPTKNPMQDIGKP